MFKMCEKCGYFYDDTQNVCPRCSAPTKTYEKSNGIKNESTSSVRSSANAAQNNIYEFYPTSSNQEEEDNGIFSSEIFEKAMSLFKKYRKASIISLGVIAGVIVLSVIISAISKNAPINIDLEDYVSDTIITDATFDEADSEDFYNYIDMCENYDIGAGLYVSGYDSQAYVNNVHNIIDWNSLIEDVNKKLEKKNGSNLYLSFWSVFDGSSFEFDMYPSEGISNGDTVTVEVSVKMSVYYDDVKFKMCEEVYSFDFEVQGLETVSGFDPYEYVEFVASGANGYGSVRPVVDSELDEELSISGYFVKYNRENSFYLYRGEEYITTIEFECENSYSSNGSYKNGDTVKMICSHSYDDISSNYGIQISQSEKTYTIANLGDYVTSSTKLSAEEVKKFTDHANATISEKYSGQEDTYKDFKHNGTYVVTYIDPETGYFKNELCLVYSYSQRGWASEDYETRYCYFAYRDLICDSAGAVQLDPDEYYESYYYGYDNAEDLLNGRYSPDYFNTTKI